MTGWPGRSFAASLAGHGVVVALLIVLVGHAPPLPPEPPAGIQIALSPTPPEPPPIPDLPPPIPDLPPPVPDLPPPVPDLPPPVPDLPPPVPDLPAPPPPVVKRPPPRRPPPQPVRQPAPLPAAVASPQPGPAVPRPAAPVISSSYRAMLSAWLESHKYYPDTARERGEQGQVILRFHVDRSGRVLSFAIAQSAGYPDLDAAVDRMMRGATLPPFPPEMTASDIEVSVAVRFSLAR